MYLDVNAYVLCIICKAEVSKPYLPQKNLMESMARKDREKAVY